jgi:bis(5'-nucleosyl)-tetraphosphatase (symmetrical)
MAVYAIGDVQGCFEALERLLAALRFDRGRDTLWFTGDLVNRGPQSAAVLRFVRALPRAVTVLGNHDLHLLAVASGQQPLRKHDSFQDVLAAPDREELLAWLRARPLLHHDPALGWTLVHAGLLPAWSLGDARRLAAEAGEHIAESDSHAIFTHMYGDSPDHWQESLAGWARLRIIINAFTRLRYCDPAGRVDLRPKGPPGSQPAPLLPWFQAPGRHSRGERIVFGHWSTLGLWEGDGVIGLDSGCLWGGTLSARRLDGPVRERALRAGACAANCLNFSLLIF